MSNEEQVLGVLFASPGAIRQGSIRDRLGWSGSKTSRVLIDMEAAGMITRVQIGREKAVYVRGEEPDCIRPHHPTVAGLAGS